MMSTSFPPLSAFSKAGLQVAEENGEEQEDELEELRAVDAGDDGSGSTSSKESTETLAGDGHGDAGKLFANLGRGKFLL